ncbi:MAG: LLM class flavin-dependent oxidoreductase, partial [Terriglobia bacterium]
SAIGAVTKRIKMGTGSLIPHRHPLLLALMINSLAYMFGERLVLSLGLGNFQHEFDAVGMGDWKRDEVVPEQVAILRKAWSEDHFSFDGKYYRFHEVGFKPRALRNLKIWYAGGTPASVRRALEYCDGWLPGRITLATYRKRVEKLRADAAAQGKPRILEGCIPITSIDEDR